MEIQTQESAVPVSATKGIDVGKIEKELAAMWKPASGLVGEHADAGVTRACALNLIVYSTETDDHAVIDEMLDIVNEQHPGRTLVLVADREASAAKLEAYVSSRCRMLGGSGKQVCGEQITIEAGGPVVATVSSAIAPLLVPDVPVFLWWKDIPHDEDQLFNRLVALSDRVVIDSASFDHPHQDLQQLSQLIHVEGANMRTSDLNWGRLTAWRTLMASFWDVPDYGKYLDGIDRVTVEYDPPRFAPAEIAPKALLVVGWLASRLGWEFARGSARAERNVTDFTFRAGGREIKVEMRGTEGKEINDGMLTSLTLSAAGGAAEFYVALSDDEKRLQTEARIDGARAVGRVLAYEAKTEGQRLSRELSFLKRDTVYEDAVSVAARLIDSLNH